VLVRGVGLGPVLIPRANETGEMRQVPGRGQPEPGFRLRFVPKKVCDLVRYVRFEFMSLFSISRTYKLKKRTSVDYTVGWRIVQYNVCQVIQSVYM
jgi:hypothetical protein